MFAVDKSNATKNALPPALSQPITDINAFITKRKLDVLYELYKSGRLSQRELAYRIGAQPSALANLLLKFENFSPKLLQKDYEGKFCYYSLSERGQRFVEDNPGLPTPQAKKNTSVPEKEDNELFLIAKESLASLEQGYGEDWPVLMNEVMMHYIRGSKISPKREILLPVNQYIRSLEFLRLHQNDLLFNQTMALLTDPINSNNVSEFLDTYFDPFSIVLKSLQNKELSLSISILLQSIIRQQQNDTTLLLAKQLNWTNEVLNDLQNVIAKIKKCIAGCTLNEIYDYFTALLPDQELLCAVISQWLQE